MAYLDNTGLSYFWGKIKSVLSSKQNKITASGILKGNGSGGVTAAVPGTDYLKTAPVTSINGKTGAVTLGKSDVGLGSVDNVRQYSATNPPPYPVTSVNGQTGDVNLTASDVGAVPTSRTVNGKALSANITLAASDVGALPSNTHIPSTVAEMSDAGNYALKSDKVSKSGDTMTGKLTVPQVETGDGNSNFFQCRKFRGEGDANAYYHAIDFGYKNHDQVDFHEYGGIWNFFKNTSGKADGGSLCGKITTNGWEGGAKLTGSPTAPTPGTSDNSTRIATTAFVNSFNSTKLESNGDGSNVTAAFTAASSRTNISTGEKLSVIFGKIAKFFSDLKTVAFTGSYNDLSDKPTIPTAVTVDSAMSDTSTNPVQNKVIKAELDKKAASSHNQAAGTITAGTFAGAVVASASNQAPGTSLLRNSKLVSSDTTPTVNGEIFWTYG